MVRIGECEVKPLLCGIVVAPRVCALLNGEPASRDRGDHPLDATLGVDETVRRAIDQSEPASM